MERPRGVTLIATAIAVVVLALVGVALWFQVDADDEPEDASAEGIELVELLAEPQRYDGQTATVTAPVGAILRPGAYVLGAEDPASGLLVVVDPEDVDVADLGVEEGEIVRATGDVEIVDAATREEFADVEEGIGFDIPDELTGEPILVASVLTAEAG